MASDNMEKQGLATDPGEIFRCVTPNSLESLRAEFIQEASDAPKLFGDLAKVEQYIAESYKTRAFIELIQNADDSQSTKFGIHDLRSGFVVCNNGRPFTFEDVEALCRSGSSHKARGGSTIGYRGIGFKSVVNLSKSVYVFSGDFAFFFNRNATESLFPNVSDVPLIRIPHLLYRKGNEELFDEVEQIKKNYDYRSLFVFQDLNERLSSEEFFGFDRSCLLFLNNLRHVELAFHGKKRIISVEVGSDKNKQHVVKIKENDNLDEWEVLHSKLDQKNTVALKKFHDNIIPALPEESVFHSFTPTIQFAGAYLKINGDYSTDPSRKTIDMDERSEQSFAEAVSVLTDSIISLLNRETIKKGFFTPLVNVKQEGLGRLKPHLLKSLSECLQTKQCTNPKGEQVALSSIRLKPEWLGYEDYEKLCNGAISFICKDLLLVYPEIMTFLEQMSVRTLLIQEAIERVNESGISALGCAQIFSKVIKQYLFDLSDERIEELKSLKIFPINDDVVTARDLKTSSELRVEFVQHLADNNDPSELKLFFKKLGLPLEHPATQPFFQFAPKMNPKPLEAQGRVEHKSKLFRAEPILTQWRSAEKNAGEFIKSLNGVLSVVDVSKANLGYDLEVLLESRKTTYVEVKSVNSFSDPFRLTNNEYSSAHSYGPNYFVALVVNGEPFQIKLIQDPVETVEFQKQCERWSWYCDNYHSNLSNIASLMSVD